MQQAVAAGAYPVRLSPRHLRQLARSQEDAPAQGGRAVETDDGMNVELINRIQAATRPSVSLNRSLDSDSGFDLLKVLGDAEKGLAAVDAGPDRVRVMDVSRDKYPPVWVSTETLFSAMDSVDENNAGRRRGYVLIRR